LPGVVVDASAIAAPFSGPSADDVVEGLGSAQLAAPSLLPYEIVCVAVRTRLTACDAAYLHLAQSLAADLVTLDDKLARVWSRLQG